MGNERRARVEGIWPKSKKEPPGLGFGRQHAGGALSWVQGTHSEWGKAKMAGRGCTIERRIRWWPGWAQKPKPSSCGSVFVNDERGGS